LRRAHADFELPKDSALAPGEAHVAGEDEFATGNAS
jgi:hypothetical protein